MGNNNSGLAVILAILGLGFLLTRAPSEGKTLSNGNQQFPWLNYQPSEPIIIEKPVFVERFTDRYFTETITKFQEAQEENEEAIEESNLLYLNVLKGAEKAEAGYLEALKLKEMVSPTRKWTETERTPESIELAKEMAQLSTDEQIRLYKLRKGL